MPDLTTNSTDQWLPSKRSIRWNKIEYCGGASVQMDLGILSFAVEFQIPHSEIPGAYVMQYIDFQRRVDDIINVIDPKEADDALRTAFDLFSGRGFV